MTIPPPSEKQARILWLAMTGLAVGILVAMVGLFCWGVAFAIGKLSGVLLPLALAGILAYLLDPVVNFLEHRLKIPRTRAILMVFFLAVMIVLCVIAGVAPLLVVELQDLVDNIPRYIEHVHHWMVTTLARLPWGIRAREAFDKLGLDKLVAEALPVVSLWVWEQSKHAISWAWLLAGFALVPVYLFYFLLEKSRIKGSWTEYLPLKESKLKEETVFVLKEINDCLIVFFRGQVLVALCVGALLTLGYLLIGLDYAVLLGMMAGLLGIIPYLGIASSLVPAVILAAVQFGWKGPVMVLGIMGLVQLLEGFYISPKIMGDRVGLHPLAIIVAVMVGTTLLGGILGGLLAIPLTAVLRTLMFRYVWKKAEGGAMKISIVVPAFNEEKVIAGSLKAMRDAAVAFTTIGWESEIIVCDNNSTDQTAALARAGGAVVVFEPVNQISRARNCGAAAATGDWIIFVDADSQPSAELFADVAEQIKRGDCIGGGSVVKMDGTNKIAHRATGLWNAFSRWKRWMAGSFIFCEAAAFRELGGFSKELFAAEELDFSKRLHRIAKRRKLRVIILTKHPLVTSARKMHLYKPWDYVRLFGRIILGAGKPLRNREQLAIWYDGRR